jgi:outer membrane usher protein
MRWLSCAVDGRAYLVFAFALILGVGFGAERLRAGQEQKNLQLEVIINDVPANMIGSFVLFDDNRIGATRNELEELGLRIGARRFPEDIVVLDDIPSLKYEYEERAQKIRVTVDNTARQGRNFDLSGGANGRAVRAQTGWGTVLNYDLLSTTGSLRELRPFSFTGTSLSLEGRAFSPYGTFEQSAILRSIPDRASEVIRLDSSFRYSDPERMITYRAGDTINGGLGWSRPIRIGGLQAQSNFALRPDLITMPLPMLGGTAAVPSTVDVYVNNIKTFSQDVGAGPFSLNNVPLVTGAGNAQLVIRDSSGHETRSTLPFYASPSLLAPGLASWSLETGLPRRSYGSTADTYAQSPVGSATLRRGIFDWMTLEGHLEGGAGVANGGFGAVVKTGTVGVAAAALSASSSSGSTGLQTYLSYETRLFGLNINASSQRTFGSYDDLASATARLQDISTSALQNIYGLFDIRPSSYFSALPPNSAAAASALYANARPPRALDRITVSAPLAFDIKSSLSASFVHMQDAAGNLSEILSGSYSRSLPYNASLYATVFHDFGASNSTGVFVGLSVPLSESVSASLGASRGPGGTSINAEVVKPLTPQPGSYGWRVRDAEGASPYREASASYRSNYGTIQVGASQDRDNSRGLVELRGSIAAMGGGIFFSNWIDDGFAVVNAGAPGLEVFHDNRPVGVTNAKGMLLVPTLRSYQKNKITVDPANLPVDVEIERTREVVAPADRSGVLVNFQVRSDTASALVAFVRPDGSFVPAGAAGRIEGGNEFIVGYDGQAFIKELKDSNLATIEFIDGTCRASFEFTPRPREQVFISPVECQ